MQGSLLSSWQLSPLAVQQHGAVVCSEMGTEGDKNSHSLNKDRQSQAACLEVLSARHLCGMKNAAVVAGAVRELTAC